MSRRPTDLQINQVKTVNPSGPLEEQAGFYCFTCKALFKSYNALLDHTMSRVHLRNQAIVDQEKQKKNQPEDVDDDKVDMKNHPIPARTAAAMDRAAEGAVTVEAIRARLDLLRKRTLLQTKLAEMDPEDRLKARLQAAEQVEREARERKRDAKKEAKRRKHTDEQ